MSASSGSAGPSASGEQPGSAPGIAALDERRLAELASELGKADLQQLLALYQADIGERAARFRALLGATANGDLLAREAHAIKGVAANIGAIAVTRLAAALEAACGAENPAGLDDLLGALEPASRAAVAAVEAWIARSAA